MTKQQLLDAMAELTQQCWNHADTCKDCYMPIMDEEGNPQYISEACSEGAELLRKYRKLESEYFG